MFLRLKDRLPSKAPKESFSRKGRCWCKDWPSYLVEWMPCTMGTHGDLFVQPVVCRKKKYTVLKSNRSVDCLYRDFVEPFWAFVNWQSDSRSYLCGLRIQKEKEASTSESSAPKPSEVSAATSPPLSGPFGSIVLVCRLLCGWGMQWQFKNLSRNISKHIYMDFTWLYFNTANGLWKVVWTQRVASLTITPGDTRKEATAACATDFQETMPMDIQQLSPPAEPGVVTSPPLSSEERREAYQGKAGHTDQDQGANEAVTSTKGEAKENKEPERVEKDDQSKPVAAVEKKMKEKPKAEEFSESEEDWVIFWFSFLNQERFAMQNKFKLLESISIYVLQSIQSRSLSKHSFLDNFSHSKHFFTPWNLPLSRLDLYLEENNEKVPVTRDDQLSIRKPVEKNEKGKGRGKGRGGGKGRGRGRGAQKGDGPQPSASSKAKAAPKEKSTKRKEPKVEEEKTGNGRGGRKSVKGNDTDGWEWGDYEEDWDEHWWQHYDQGDWEGWNNQGKMWDQAAWHDGKSSLHKLSKQSNSKSDSKADSSTAEPKKQTSRKRKEHTDTIPEGETPVANSEPKQPKDKKSKKENAKDKESAPAAEATADDIQAGTHEPKEVKEPKSKRKAKTTPETEAPKKAPKAKSAASAKHKPAAPLPAAPLLDALQMVDHRRGGADQKVLDESMMSLKKFAEKYMGIEHKENFDGEKVKDRLRKKTLGSDDFHACGFNVYWKRPAVGVTSRQEKRDFAYFHIPCIAASQKKDNCYAKMAIALKSSAMLVSNMHLSMFMCGCSVALLFLLSRIAKTRIIFSRHLCMRMFSKHQACMQVFATIFNCWSSTPHLFFPRLNTWTRSTPTMTTLRSPFQWTLLSWWERKFWSKLAGTHTKPFWTNASEATEICCHTTGWHVRWHVSWYALCVLDVPVLFAGSQVLRDLCGMHRAQA